MLTFLEVAHRLPQPPAAVEIQEGDSIPRIAAKFGFLTETVWNCDDNTSLRNKRRAMFARVGENLAIPLRQPRQLSVQVGNSYYLRIPSQGRLRSAL